MIEVPPESPNSGEEANILPMYHMDPYGIICHMVSYFCALLVFEVTQRFFGSKDPCPGPKSSLNAEQTGEFVKHYAGSSRFSSEKKMESNRKKSRAYGLKVWIVFGSQSVKRHKINIFVFLSTELAMCITGMAVWERLLKARCRSWRRCPRNIFVPKSQVFKQFKHPDFFVKKINL